MNEISTMLVAATEMIPTFEIHRLDEQLADNLLIEQRLEEQRLTLDRFEKDLETIVKRENLDELSGKFSFSSIFDVCFRLSDRR